MKKIFESSYLTEFLQFGTDFVTRCCCVGLIMALSGAAVGQSSPATLATGSTMPEFRLTGTDGKVHASSEWKGSRVLAVVFLSNHCTASQLYERRVNQMVQGYEKKSVTVVAIQASNPKAFTEEDLAWSDVGESLDDMKERATFRKFAFPYLYDGETGATALALGATVAPSIYIFDHARKLQYSGRIDSDPENGTTATHYASAAIDALLAGTPVAAASVPAKGCELRLGADKAIAQKKDAGVVDVSLASLDTLSKLRKNPSGKLLMVNFYATWCGPCVAEFPDLMATNRMYRNREFAFTTVSSNTPAEKEEVIAFLRKQNATTNNLLYGSDDVYAMQEAFDPNVGSAVPITVLLAPDGQLLLDQKGEIELLDIRRGILANLPDDADHEGAQEYWRIH